jgi:hypothetical protein
VWGCLLQFDAIMKLPRPQVREGADAALQLLVANIDYDSFKGKLGIGRIRSGKLKKVCASARSRGCPLCPLCWFALDQQEAESISSSRAPLCTFAL